MVAAGVSLLRASCCMEQALQACLGQGEALQGSNTPQPLLSTWLLPAAPGRAPGVEISWEFSLFPDSGHAVLEQKVL